MPGAQDKYPALMELEIPTELKLTFFGTFTILKLPLGEAERPERTNVDPLNLIRIMPA
jgi:hypothetical protein